MKRFTLLLLSALALLITLPQLAMAQAAPKPHLWHIIKAAKGSGTWSVSMVYTSVEKSRFITTGGKIEQDFQTPNDAPNLTPDNPVKVGFLMPKFKDFNLAYMITIQNQGKGNNLQYTVPTCEYLITATGPGQPVTNVISDKNAICHPVRVVGNNLEFDVDRANKTI